MKTVTELRALLKKLFDDTTKELEEMASSKAPLEMDAETSAVYDKVTNDIEELIGNSLKKDVLYCVPSDDFYTALSRVLECKHYELYDVYEVAPDLTDEQILAHSWAIERGDTSALESLRKIPAQKEFVAMLDGDFHRRRQIFNNLAYYYLVLAHLAKHYNSREAAQKYLRAASILRKAIRRLPLDLSEAARNELLSIAPEADDELKIAADYYALTEWDGFRTAEAVKFEKIKADAAKVQEKNEKDEK